MTEPKTAEELLAYIKAAHATVRDARGADEGYQAAADFVADVAIAAFGYAARVEGITGFQASWASLRFLAHVQNINGPFAIVAAERMLFPQYSPPTEEARKYEQEWRPWLAKEAAKRMADSPRSEVSPTVWAHWEALAAFDGGEP